MPEEEASQTKRLKTPTQISFPIPDNQSPPNSKGKSKIQSEPSNDCCGICLSENGGGIVSRGFIDSCDHFFCFVCIMEWSKVESKCPLCKRRFSTIRRPVKPYVFESERVVRVPVRDQVHYYFGNSTTGPPDPYSEVKCIVCHGTEDESLILLCDLCDAGSHTYCVGLGMTVPEGDWFCVECQILRDEHSKSETVTSTGDHHSNPMNEDVSIFDIVREPTLLAVQRLRSLSSNSRNFPQSSLASRGSSISYDITNSRNRDDDGKCPTKSNARTLLHCRNLQDRIRLLRENWNGFRSGALRFSSGSSDISSHRPIGHKSGEGSASCMNQQSKFQSGSSKIAVDKGVKKAWKLLDKAKSLSPSSGKSSKYLVRKSSTPNNPEFTKRMLPLDASRNGESFASRCNLRDYEFPSCFEGSVLGRSSTQREVDSLKAVQTHAYLDDYSVRRDAKITIEEPLTILSRGHDIEANGNCSTHKNAAHPKEKSQLDKICVDHQQYEEAKNEIQSLVKLNLKLETKEEKLGADVFKEVARTSTHWVLAACGMERAKPDSPIRKGMSCSHSSELGQPQKSSLMPDCCRKCFYMFVKDTINTAVLRRKMTHKKHS